jgi:hypothetical protein
MSPNKSSFFLSCSVRYFVTAMKSGTNPENWHQRNGAIAVITYPGSSEVLGTGL